MKHLPSPDSSPEPVSKRLKSSVGVEVIDKSTQKNMSSDEEFDDDLVYEDDDEGFGEDAMEHGMLQSTKSHDVDNANVIRI